jgi:hypothetical protein
MSPHVRQDRLPQTHIAYYTSDSVDSFDLSAFHQRYGTGGSSNLRHHPAMM